MTARNLPKGTKVKIISNSSGHGHPLGSIVSLRNNVTSRTTQLYADTPTGGWFAWNDIETVPITIEEFEDQKEAARKLIRETEVEIESINKKIEYLKENNLKLFDEDEFKAFSTLKTLEDTNLNTLDKAKKIASLFK